MQKTFQKWLLAFVAIAFLVTFTVSFRLQTETARENTLLLIGLKIEDVKKEITVNQKNLQSIRTESDKTALTKARTFAWILKLYPEIATNYDRLVETAEKLGADGVEVIDGKGIIIGSAQKEHIGYDMSSAAQSKWFMAILDDPTLELAQDPQPKGLDGTIMQYAGVTRLDAPGFVQIAYYPKRLEDAMAVANIENLAPGFRVGQNGKMMITSNNVIVSIAESDWTDKNIQDYGLDPALINSPEKTFQTSIRGTDYICSFDQFKDYTIIGMLPSDEMYLSRNSTSVQVILFNLILFGVVFILISILVQRLVINDIYKVNSSLHKITSGDLNEKVDINSSREFSLLSNGINTTVAALRKAIADAAARLDAELEFARAIQLSSLPRIFPPYPNRKDFDLHAVMFTAKEVGGDFYDFFLVDDTHLVAIIADVSGKGIPASLFMMSLKPFIRSYAEAKCSPAEVFTKTNHHLCENSNDKMFVTAFMVFLDTQTGVLTYVNAGHNPPLIRKADGTFSYMKPKPGLVLAAMDGIEYKQAEVQLQKGEMLFLYTDGVTEALNPKLELFSDARLLDCLNKIPADASPVEVLCRIKADVDEFANGAQQADDITMLALQYLG